VSDVHIKSSDRTPEFKFISSACELSFSGESYPENALSFYKPILEKIAILCESDTPLVIKFKLIYMNSSSLGIFRNMMNTLNAHAKRGNKVVVVWMHFDDDDDTREIGEDFHELFSSIEFQFSPITD